MTIAVPCLPVRNKRLLVASSCEAFRKKWMERPTGDLGSAGEAAGGADALAKLESESWAKWCWTASCTTWT